MEFNRVSSMSNTPVNRTANAAAISTRGTHTDTAYATHTFVTRSVWSQGVAKTDGKKRYAVCVKMVTWLSPTRPAHVINRP